MDNGIVLAVMGATVAAFLGGAGSSIGVGIAGSKGTGVLSERPDLFGKVLVMTALPGSQGVYGLLVAIFSLSKAGLLGEEVALSVEAGHKILWAGVLMGFAGLFSGWFQGRVVAGGLGTVARDESLLGKSIVLSVVVETYAIFGLLVSILLINSI